MLKNILLLFLLTLLFSCSKNDKENIVIEPTDETMAIASYEEAMDALKKGDAFFATKKFKEVESLMPQSNWAAKASLMASYSEYTRNAYESSIFGLERNVNCKILYGK